MAIFLRLALYGASVFLSASELVIDVQPSVISLETTPQLVINCSITNNQVQHLDVIKSLTLSRNNETLKEFEDLLVLNSSTLNLKQFKPLPNSQISFGNLYITLTLHNPTEFDAKVYKCNATGDNAEGTNISLFVLKAVEYETNSTALIEEMRRRKKDENSRQCYFNKHESSDLNQRSRVHFYGSSDIIKERVEPWTLNCLYKFVNHDQKETPTLQSLFILHETNGVLAYINKGQPAVSVIQGVHSKNVKGELYGNESVASYLQIMWSNLKISDSGKYFCEAHVKYSEGRSEKFNEMLTITVQSSTLNDLVNVIEKLITQVDEDKESIQVNKQNIENLKEDANTKKQNLERIIEDIDTNKQNITSIKVVMDTNTRNIKKSRDEMDTNITRIKEYMDINSRNMKNSQESHNMMMANFSAALIELKNQINEGTKSLILLASCRYVQSSEPRVIVTLTSGLKVMCDTMTNGGGWIIFQRRINGKVDFYRGWKEYRDGFGDYNIGEFYLGNEHIFKLTSSGQYDLRIDLEFKNKPYFAQYKDFKVLSETEKYKLQIGQYLGDAGDGLKNQNNMFFTTFDRDNDIWSIDNCAKFYLGAWWHHGCHLSNLNGKWGSKSYGEGLNWADLTGYHDGVSFSEMKIRERT
uniref:Fibrinogen C-terminal domain-containing protein n=1 Tax=Biomphalaria glabrata TaxID=6526 RepID=A0A2C9KDK9_BIOGL